MPSAISTKINPPSCFFVSAQHDPMSISLWDVLTHLDHNSTAFPDTRQALSEPNGLLAIGGDLSIERLQSAYQHGIFPWYIEQYDPILWWSPSPRCILRPENIHISKSMKKCLRNDSFAFSFDQSFPQVIKACQASREQAEVDLGHPEDTTHTWIGNDLLEAYCDFHRAGFAHSVEVWQHNELVGGLYGVALGNIFFGESMFSKTSNASKAALICLANHWQHWGGLFIDCQVKSEHLMSMGAEEVSRNAFENLLVQGKSHTLCDYVWKINSNWREQNL